jgi:hypothetical protein
MSLELKGFKVITLALESSGEIISNEGLWVVAPIRIIRPLST